MSPTAADDIYRRVAALEATIERLCAALEPFAEDYEGWVKQLRPITEWSPDTSLADLAFYEDVGSDITLGELKEAKEALESARKE